MTRKLGSYLGGRVHTGCGHTPRSSRLGEPAWEHTAADTITMNRARKCDDLEEVLAVIDGRIISPQTDLTAQVAMACGADLMSDVLAFTHEGTLLLTGLTNPRLYAQPKWQVLLPLYLCAASIPPPRRSHWPR